MTDANVPISIPRADDFVADGKLSRMEFCVMCKDYLYHIPHSRLNLAMQNLLAVSAAQRKRNAAHWRRMAQQVDDCARQLLPLTYCICLIALFHLDFSDSYAPTMSEMSEAGFESPQMFSGFGTVALVEHASIILPAFTLVGIGALVGWFVTSTLAARRLQQREQRRRDRADKGTAVSGFDALTAPVPLFGSSNRTAAVGPLAGLRVPSCSVQPCPKSSILIDPKRFESLNELSAPPVTIEGPPQLVSFFKSVKLYPLQLRLRLSPFASVNLPIEARLSAGIPIPAASFAFIHPLPGLASDQREALAARFRTHGELGCELVLNGGFAYIDQSGLLLQLNAILSGEQASPHFFFSGPFPLPQEVHTRLSCTRRYAPVVEPHATLVPAMASEQGAEQQQQQQQKQQPQPQQQPHSAAWCAWVRPTEFLSEGVRSPFGGFAYSSSADGGLQEGGGAASTRLHHDESAQPCAAYVRLIPTNVPSAQLSVVLGDDDDSVSQYEQRLAEVWGVGASRDDAAGSGAAAATPLAERMWPSPEGIADGGGRSNVKPPMPGLEKVLVPLGTMCSDIKLLIEARAGVPAETQRLELLQSIAPHAAVELSDHATLEAFDIGGGQCITVRLMRRERKRTSVRGGTAFESASPAGSVHGTERARLSSRSLLAA